MINFVGAGSGAEDLITVRGQKLLKEADVIIYAGSLVNPKLLDVKKNSCMVYNSIKRSDRPTVIRNLSIVCKQRC